MVRLLFGTSSVLIEYGIKIVWRELVKTFQFLKTNKRGQRVMSKVKVRKCPNRF